MIDKTTGNVMLDREMCIMPLISKKDFISSSIFNEVVQGHKKLLRLRSFFALEIQEMLGQKVCVDLFFKKNILKTIEIYDARMQTWTAYDKGFIEEIESFHKYLIEVCLDIKVQDVKVKEVSQKKKHDIETKKEKRKKRMQNIEKQRIEQTFDTDWGKVIYIVDGIGGEVKIKLAY